MSNKTDLQALNAQYESLIDTLRGKAVGGGALETCTVTVNGFPAPGAMLYYIDATLQYHEQSIMGSGISVEVLKNSLVVTSSTECALTGATLVDGNNEGIGICAYLATG